MENCKICSGDFNSSPDSMVLCDHHDGFVHFGCCVHKCSSDGKPCEHCVAQYDRMSNSLG